jgi:adenylate cyclase
LEAAANGGKELVELFERGREAYKRQEWRVAKSLFEEVLQRWPEDSPAQIFLARCNEYLAAKPADDWDGVYEMKRK